MSFNLSTLDKEQDKQWVVAAFAFLIEILKKYFGRLFLEKGRGNRLIVAYNVFVVFL